MIGNLQLLRGVAAMTVAVGHAGLWLGDVQPVATFFVISGFIMCFISEKDAADFLPRRIVRIVPFYWLCTALYLIVVHHWGFFRPWSWSPQFATLLGRSLLFIPSDDLPPLGVGWTLNLEMYFYVVFAVALAINRKFAPLIAATAIAAVFLAHSAGCSVRACEYYSHPYVWYFLAGIALFYLWRPLGSVLPRWLAVLAGAALLGACYGGIAPFPIGWLPTIVVGAALVMSATGADLQWRPLLLIGDASYAIYLMHPAVIEWTHRHSIDSVPIIAVLCLATGILTHLAIEKPLHHWALAKYRSYARTPVALPAE